MLARPVPSRAEGNPLYPLPPDYFDLGDEGQRQARVNACRQWLLPGTRIEKGERFAECLRFFDAYYLTADIAEDGTILWDPLFIDHDLRRPRPLFHWTIFRSAGSVRKTAFVGPRGSAKTKGIFAPMIMMPMISKPTLKITYATSTNELAEEMGDDTKFQLYNNERILEDWCPEYDGRVKPSRSEGKQGMGAYKLSNRASFFATSAQSRQRGQRPHFYFLDDPEWDPKHSTAVEVLAEGMEQLLFSIALPMVQQPGTHLVWGGTFVSLRHYLWQAMQVETITVDGQLVERSVEKRFGSWRRIIQPAADIVTTPEGPVRRSVWPEMWPTDVAEKTRLNLPEDTQTLDDIEEEIGTDRFQTEFMANPGQGKGAYFPALTDNDHFYWVREETIDEDLTLNPSRSRAVFEFMRKTGASYTKVSLPVAEIFARFPRFMLCDASDTATKLSDFKTAMCLCLTDHNELLILDHWSDQCEEDDQINEIFKMGDRWLVSVIDPEEIKSGRHLKEALLARVQTRASDVLQVSHMPQVRGFNPGPTEKTDKIKAIRWRFTSAKVKLPKHLRHEPPMRRLITQIANFHPYADNGGLAKDDDIDTLAMHPYVVKTTPFLSKPQEAKDTSPLARMKMGEVLDEKGRSLYRQINNLSAKDLDEILEAIQKKNTAQGTTSGKSLI